MTCQHCVARVEAAILAVPDVVSADVHLDAGRATVSGGLPHEVIAAVEAAGYGARPRAREPESCELPAAPPETGSAAAQGGYRIDIDDMTCASCVARVEKAVLGVDGVQDASANLVEGAAYVVGGDPQQVVDAIVDQGYPAALRAG